MREHNGTGNASTGQSIIVAAGDHATKEQRITTWSTDQSGATITAGQLAYRDVLEHSIIVAVAFLSRLPFLNAGHGNDPDAWRVASAARVLATTGTYVPSRLPGYPLQEMSYALRWPASPFAFNLLTAIFSAWAVLFFNLSLRRLGCKDAGLASLALAFTPVVFINSTNSMDYVWALAFLMGSLYFTLNRRPAVAGLFLGLAIGCRITSGAMLLPLSLVLIRTGDTRSGYWLILRFALTSCFIGAVCFIPVFAVYGLRFFHFAEAVYPGPLELISRMSVALWGAVGSGVMLAAIGATLIGFGTAIQSQSLEGMQFRVRTACMLAIALYIVAFLRLPIEAAYLVPAIPFTIILLAALLARPLFQIVCVSLLVASFVGIGTSVLDNGPIIADRSRRIATAQEVQRTIWLGSRLRDKSVIVVGPLLPQIEYTKSSSRSGPRYVYELDRDEASTYRSQGYRIYFTRGMREYNQRLHDLDLEQFGATELRPSSHPSEQIE